MVIVFSYATTSRKGHHNDGANNLVCRVANILRDEYDMEVHMRNGNLHAEGFEDDEAFDARGNVGDKHDDWWEEWRAFADGNCVVKFIDAKYQRSKWCQKESNFCNGGTVRQQMSLDYQGNSAAAIAEHIVEHLR